MPKALFRPGSALTYEQRAGDVANGESWLFWRYDSSGEPWYKLSGTITSEAPIVAEDDTLIRGVPAAQTDVEIRGAN